MWLALFRYFLFFLGLTFFGLGNAIAVNVKFLGLHPWEVLNMALYQRFGWTIGTWSVICGLFLILVSSVVARKYINIGTFLNALLIGPIMDFFLKLDILPHATHLLWINLLILLSGIGAGPRDGFMLAISDKTGLSVSRARIIVESFVLVIGYILGGPVFIVTFLYTFIQSPIFQRSFKRFQELLYTLERKKKDNIRASL
ncbi:hypothetical protein CN507_01300 [Bacillus cereus]|nr:hypothetical protein CN507_01300 [Bacillus cereus]